MILQDFLYEEKNVETAWKYKKSVGNQKIKVYIATMVLVKVVKFSL